MYRNASRMFIILLDKAWLTITRLLSKKKRPIAFRNHEHSQPRWTIVKKTESETAIAYASLGSTERRREGNAFVFRRHHADDVFLGCEVEFRNTFETFLEMRLYAKRVLRLRQNFQQFIIRQKKEPIIPQRLHSTTGWSKIVSPDRIINKSYYIVLIPANKIEFFGHIKVYMKHFNIISGVKYSIRYTICDVS